MIGTNITAVRVDTTGQCNLSQGGRDVALQDVCLDASTPFADERLTTREPQAQIPMKSTRSKETPNFAIFLNIHKTKASLRLSASQQSQNELEVKFEVDLLSVPP
jgi:hypothetical protein